MPVFISDSEVIWNETVTKINAVVPLADPARNASVSMTRRYLKVSSPPFMWECFLHDEIDTEASIARFGPCTLNFELCKKEEKFWGSLKHEYSGNKSFCKEQRNISLEEAAKEFNSKAERNSALKHKARREAVKKQMHIDDTERKRIHDTKMKEMQIALGKIEVVSKVTSETQEGPTSSVDQEPSVVVIKKDLPVKGSKPVPRKYSSIAVNFTPRVFPTAARESQEQEETQWLKSQNDIRRYTEFHSFDLRPEEHNPTWLENKGNELCRKQSYLAAINAFNLALTMCPTKYSLYASRGFCHLHLRNFHKAVEDSSKALELLSMSVPCDTSCKVKSHICRGKAFSELELPAEGFLDFKEALRLEPSNENLKKDAEKLRSLLLGCS